MKYDKLQLKQMDAKFDDWRKLQIQKPAKGWINLIRTVLGISSYRLAKMVGVNQARIIQVEKAEQNGAVKLQTLEKFAEALDCRLVYSLVPNTSLEHLVNKQAKKIAKNRVTRVAHSMKLEAQAVDEEAIQQQIQDQAKELLSGSLKKLWNENDEI